jgi:uncharacterized membrane protein
MWNAWDIFHPEVLAIPLLLGAYLLALRGRWGGVVALLGLTLMVKEDAAIAVVPLGLFVAWRFRRRLEGYGIAIFGTGLLLLNTLVVLPALSPTGDLVHIGRYAQFGDSLGGALKGMVTDPALFFTELFGSERLRFYLQMLGPIPTALLAPEILLVAGPIVAANALSFKPLQYDIMFHYTAYALAIGTIAAVSGAARLVRRWKDDTERVVAIVLLAAVLGFTLASPWGVTRDDNPWAGAAKTDEEVAAVDAAIALIPRDAAVAADWFTATHLAEREVIYMLPNPFHNRLYGAGEPYAPSPSDVDWVITQRWALDDVEVGPLLASLQSGDEWEVVVDNEVVLALKRPGVPQLDP